MFAFLKILNWKCIHQWKCVKKNDVKMCKKNKTFHILWIFFKVNIFHWFKNNIFYPFIMTTDIIYSIHVFDLKEKLIYYLKKHWTSNGTSITAVSECSCTAALLTEATRLSFGFSFWFVFWLMQLWCRGHFSTTSL